MKPDMPLLRELVALSMACVSRVRLGASEGDLEAVGEASAELAGHLEEMELAVGVSTPQALFAE